MICTVCETRFAPFPLEDFEITSSGILLKNPQAREKRSQIFESNEPGICGPECEEILNAQPASQLEGDAMKKNLVNHQ